MAKNDVIIINKIESRPRYHCDKCPGYCCSYTIIELEKKDIKRLAKHLGQTIDETQKKDLRFDKETNSWIFKHQKDEHYTSICKFFDTNARLCTVYEGRPDVCRDYPIQKSCGYYDFLRFERSNQDDPTFVAITNHE